MLSSLVGLVFTNSKWAAFLAIIVFGLGRLSSFQKRPALMHLMWFGVLLRLIIPPIVAIPILPAHSISATRDAVAENVPYPSSVQIIPTEVTRSEGDVVNPHRAIWLAWWDVSALLVAVSFAGTVILLARNLSRGYRISRLLRQSNDVPAQLIDLTRQLALEIRISKPPHVALIDGLSTPSIRFGMRGWTLLWPRHLIGMLDENQCSCIVTHELAHMKRRDQWFNLVAALVQHIQWWNPLVWWSIYELHAYQEAACDAVAIMRNPRSRRLYAETLLQVVDSWNHSAPFSAMLMGFGNRSVLKRRIAMIANPSVRARVSTFVTLLVVLSVVSFFCLPVRAEKQIQTDRVPHQADALKLADKDAQQPQVVSNVASSEDAVDESKAIAKVELLGGKFVRDDTLPGNPIVGVSFAESQRFNEKFLHLLKEFKSLKTLDLRRTQITDAGMKEIGKLRTLMALDLTNTQITDQGLQELKDLSLLMSLNLNFTQVTDAGMKELKRLPKLRELDLGWTRIGDEGVKEIAQMTDLTTLWLIKTQVTDSGLKEIGRLTNLMALSLHGAPITDNGMKDLGGLHNLVQLMLAEIKISDAGLKELSELKNLEYLSVGSSEITDVGMKVVSGFTKLTTLSVNGRKITDVGLMELKDLEHLSWLQLTENQITGVGFKALGKLKNLTHVHLLLAKVTDAGLKEICEFTSLKHLDISYSAVTATGLIELAKLKNLERLGLEMTNLADDDLHNITGLQNITWLSINGTKVTDVGLKQLGNLKNLKMIWLKANGITDTGIKELKVALPNVQTY